MAGRKKNPEQTAATWNAIIEKSYELFSTKSIEAVTITEIAKASGYRDMTIYRYFPTKPILVVAVAAWKWGQVFEEIVKDETSRDFDSLNAAEVFEMYLDSFLRFYRHHADLLRFTQYLNVYIKSENVETKILEPYQNVIKNFRKRFHETYLKAEQDHTIRTDEPEDKMFSKVLHLMLAVVTRYAVGLVYIPENGFEPEEELETQKRMLMREYVRRDAETL